MLMEKFRVFSQIKWLSRTDQRKGIESALLSAILLGSAPVFGKQAILVGFSPMAVVALRKSIAVALLLVIMVIFKRQYFYIFPVGLVGCVIAGVTNGLGSILYYSAIARLDASVGQLLYSFYPLFVALWLLLDRQTISRITIFRLILVIPGIFLLVGAGKNGVDMIGALLMLGAAALYGLHLIINQRVLYEVPAPTVTLYTLLAMAATVLIGFAFSPELPPTSAPWWPVLGMAAITFLSRLTLFMGVKHLGGMQTALLGLGEVIVTVFLAQIWLGETLTTLQWMGASLVFISLFLVGFDKITREKRSSTGLFAWLNPPKIPSSNFPWQNDL